MKYCVKCGAEQFDDAVICTKCGRVIENPTTVSREKAQRSTAPSDKLTVAGPSNKLAAFNFVFSVLVLFTLFFMTWAIGYGYVKIGSYVSYIYPDPDIMLVAFLSSVLSFAFGLVSFIITLVERHKGERLFSGITKLIIGVSLVLLTAILAF
ncbi:MAG: hypothetical protein E7585_05085 [Ruminococcaceae bacterium]|nr:hypothetical protein [Oscillospiraceae bacterium]